MLEFLGLYYNYKCLLEKANAIHKGKGKSS